MTACTIDGIFVAPGAAEGDNRAILGRFPATGTPHPHRVTARAGPLPFGGERERRLGAMNEPGRIAETAVGSEWIRYLAYAE